MLCGSGLKAVMEATLRIQANFGDLYVAGGVESIDVYKRQGIAKFL